jgi:DNA polymerase-3 subunit epsilon
VVLYSLTECREFLEQLCSRFDLCPKYCHLQDGVSTCSHFRLGPCKGICRGEESITAYNEKVTQAIQSLTEERVNFIIREKGRNPDEDALVVVRDGLYYGYGFIPKETQVSSLEDLLAYVTPQKETLEDRRLISSYVVKNRENLIQLG